MEEMKELIAKKKGKSVKDYLRITRSHRRADESRG
jgi:hypothetical protein